MDGRLLALARERLAETAELNQAETKRRHEQVYALSPRVREIDFSLRAIMAELFKMAFSGGDVASLEKESLDLQMERAETLVSLGFEDSYLDEVVSCEQCRDTGYVMGRMCSCLEKLYDAEVAKSLSSLIKVGDESFEKFNLAYYSAEKNQSGVSPRMCMESVYKTCLAFAENFAPGRASLLFRGGPGLGKTFLAACIAGKVSEKGFSVVYESANDAFEAFEEKKFSRTEGSDAEKKVERMLSADLLILDDLGTELPGAFASAALYTILNKRIEKGVSTIITTNLSEADISRRYGQQTASRIEGEFDELRFYGSDIRRLKKELGI